MLFSLKSKKESGAYFIVRDKQILYEGISFEDCVQNNFYLGAGIVFLTDIQMQEYSLINY